MHHNLTAEQRDFRLGPPRYLCRSKWFDAKDHFLFGLLDVFRRGAQGGRNLALHIDGQSRFVNCRKYQNLPRGLIQDDHMEMSALMIFTIIKKKEPITDIKIGESEDAAFRLAPSGHTIASVHQGNNHARVRIHDHSQCHSLGTSPC
jgi:hypothetical protein